MTQINRVVRDLGVSGPVTGARLVLSSSTPGAAFTGFASVIDETTNDPTAVLAQPASVSGSAPYTWLLPASAHSNGANGAFYTTNVAVANVGAAPASFTMEFLGNNGSAGQWDYARQGTAQTFNLESGTSVIYFDVLGSVFNETSNFGALRVTSSSPSLNIVSVTSTPGFGGTLSQTVPAVSSSDLIPAGSSTLDPLRPRGRRLPLQSRPREQRRASPRPSTRLSYLRPARPSRRRATPFPRTE